MKDNNVAEGNKLIAEFMGMSSYTTEYDTFYKKGQGCTPENYNYHELHLEYHTSWDWLMPVVEKIDSLGYSTTIASDMRKGITDRYCAEVIKPEKITETLLYKYHPTSKIEAVWLAIVEFIKWYNSQQK